jgi:hypothetical protein
MICLRVHHQHKQFYFADNGWPNDQTHAESNQYQHYVHISNGEWNG